MNHQALVACGIRAEWSGKTNGTVRVRNRIVLHIGLTTELAVSPDEFEKFESRIQKGELKPFKKLKPTFPTMFEELELDSETTRQINEVISAFKLKSGDSI